MSECVLECSGVGAKAFLQGQLTCNVNELKENQPQLAACCNLQGRVIFTAYVTMKNDQCFLLIIPESMKDIVVSHLEKYARFSKCTLRYIVHVGASGGSPSSQKQKIQNGIPTIYPETSEKIIAQRLNLHLIPGAISFKKGCYLGQEIIARLHFKGSLKHHMYLGAIPASTVIDLNAKILNIYNEEAGFVVDYYIDADRILILFVNAIENTLPKLENNQEIILLDVPYFFKVATPDK